MLIHKGVNAEEEFGKILQMCARFAGSRRGPTLMRSVFAGCCGILFINCGSMRHICGPPLVVPLAPYSPTPAVNEVAAHHAFIFVSAPLPSPTPAVVEVVVDHAPAVESVPRSASVFTFGSGVCNFSSAAVAGSVAPTRLQSSTPAVEDDAVPPGYLLIPAHGLPAHDSPATPPSSPRTGARYRLLVLRAPLSSTPSASPSSSRGRRAGLWSPTVLGLANSIAPMT